MQTGGGLGGPGGRNGGAAPGWPRTPLSKSLPLTADLGLLLGSAWAHARAHGRHLYACLAHSGDPCTQLLGGSQPVFVSCLLRLLPHLPLPSRISHLTQRPSASPCGRDRGWGIHALQDSILGRLLRTNGRCEPQAGVSHAAGQ